jgi:hypothetical protein
MLEALPNRYNVKTKLRVDVSDFRPNDFRFDLRTQE